tara:strand:- start:53941 stop:55275 length:1335 start_codon:yes stop_codon:yes gene_type:complete
MKELTKKILESKANVGVIGLGYVGLPLAIRFSEEGFKTIGFDTDENKVDLLKENRSYIKHISEKEIQKLNETGFFPTVDFKKIADVDVIVICVPTPLGVHNEPDLSYIRSTLALIHPFLKYNQLLILESTTYPGTTEEVIQSFIESKNNNEDSMSHNRNLVIGENFFIGYSPEREDPGNKDFSTKTIPKVVSGITQTCLNLTKKLYDKIIDHTVPVSSPKVAEMTKILENIHRAVNIGLVNELKMVADKMNIDIYEVISAASTKPFGFTPYYPGPGLGGHCIPIDPFYLTWKAKEYGMNTRFIELAGEINTNMPNYVVQKVSEGLNVQGKSIKNSDIFVLGLSYKKNVDDLRESPSLEIIDILIEKGARVSYADPYFDSIPSTRKHNIELKSVDVNQHSLKGADIVILATDHDSFDYKLIESESKIIIDTRGRFLRNKKNVIKA